jgi:hypothetical protein
MRHSISLRGLSGRRRKGGVISNWHRGDIWAGAFMACPRKIQMSVFLQFRGVSGTLFWVGRAPRVAHREPGITGVSQTRPIISLSVPRIADDCEPDHR